MIAPLALPSEDIGAALGALGSMRSGGASVATAIYVSQAECLKILESPTDFYRFTDHHSQQQVSNIPSTVCDFSCNGCRTPTVFIAGFVQRDHSRRFERRTGHLPSYHSCCGDCECAGSVVVVQVRVVCGRCFCGVLGFGCVLDNQLRRVSRRHGGAKTPRQDCYGGSP